jgi:hypothetical protein
LVNYIGKNKEDTDVCSHLAMKVGKVNTKLPAKGAGIVVLQTDIFVRFYFCQITLEVFTY